MTSYLRVLCPVPSKPSTILNVSGIRSPRSSPYCSPLLTRLLLRRLRKWVLWSRPQALKLFLVQFFEVHRRTSTSYSGRRGVFLVTMLLLGVGRLAACFGSGHFGSNFNWMS